MIRKGTKVVWKHGNSYEAGKVIDTFRPKPKGKDQQNPGAENKKATDKVLLIERNDGYKLIKRESEVSRSDDCSLY